MEKENIDNIIEYLEKAPETPNNIQELANLYIVRDNLQKKTE